jgi:enoyl-CoA hydratase
MSGSVELLREGALARLVLTAPQRKNALSVTMWRALGEQLHRLSQDASLRVIVLTGAGADFCAGAHIGEFAQERYDRASGTRYHEETIRPVLQALLECDKPLIAAIRGHCVGGGLELAACCDLRVADTSAHFGVPVLHRGFPLAPFEMACVLNAFDRSAVMRLLLEGVIIDARQALVQNLVHAINEPHEFDQALRALADRVAAASPIAVAQTKRLLRRYDASHASMRATDAADYAFFDSNDYREGIAAFLDKRAPRFTST